MIRGRTTAVIRSRPQRRSGNTNGRDWSFSSVEILDEDFNKVDVVLDDDVDPSLFGEGAKVELIFDARVSGGRLRLTVIDAKPASAVKAA